MLSKIVKRSTAMIQAILMQLMLTLLWYRLKKKLQLVLVTQTNMAPTPIRTIVMMEKGDTDVVTTMKRRESTKSVRKSTNLPTKKKSE